MSRRYAIYFVPPSAPPADEALWRFGCAVLGYDAGTGADLPQAVPPGVDPERFRALTEDPRTYGFHATVKAPFRLAEGAEEAELVSGLNAFTLRQAPFALPKLLVTPVGRAGRSAFVALVEPGQTTPALTALERATVQAFERFRAPLTEAEIARRRPETLTERQRLHLEAYGYPYVFEDFRFHLTLTGRVPGEELDPVLSGLTEMHAAAVPAGPVEVAQLALFRQEAPGHRFRVLARAPFGARA